jgi:glutathione synthase/RimK-type ligase-like ATP-grasp enzyme
MRPKIALATNDEYPELVEGEVLLLKAFVAAGYDTKPVTWNDPSVEWKLFDCVILRACWGYHEKVVEFRAWLDMLAVQGVTLLNPQEIVRWNMHKGYLLELKQAGVPIPQTVLVQQNDTRNLAKVLAEFTGDDFIIKPCYGASAFGIMKVTRSLADLPENGDAYTRLLTHSDVLVQAFVPEIAAGEISAIFFDGTFSHAVTKKPKADDFRSQPEYGGIESRIELENETLAKVHELYSACNKKVLYARLDFVLTANEPLLMELELIEPYLFFDFDDGAADRFVRAFEKFTRLTVEEV